MLNYNNRYQLSAGDLIDYKGDRVASVREKEEDIPTIGSYILFNEIERYHGIGFPGATQRGVGQVVGFTSHLVKIEVYRTPTYKVTETFRIHDIRLGLLKWRELSEYIYVSKQYSYSELDINNPHDNIKKLIVKK